MSLNEFFNEWLRFTIALGESEKGRLIDALANFAINGEEKGLKGKERPIFPIFSSVINEGQKERNV